MSRRVKDWDLILIVSIGAVWFMGLIVLLFANAEFGNDRAHELEMEKLRVQPVAAPQAENGGAK